MKLISILTVLCFLFASCTSITRGTKDVLVIETKPSNAQVQLSNGLSCSSTPCALKMPRRSEVVLNITRKGCEPAVVNVTHRTANAGAAGLAGNVLLGGVVGLAIDGSTGASQDLVPNPVKVDLLCKK
jgi:hypothetical protein